MAQHTFQCGRSVGSPTGRVLTSLVNTFCGLRRCIWGCEGRWLDGIASAALEGKLLVMGSPRTSRSEEHTSELQSRENLVCRLLLEKKKQIIQLIYHRCIDRI